VLGSEHIRGDVWKWAYKGDVRDGFGGVQVSECI